jgi:hypothetical protein
MRLAFVSVLGLLVGCQDGFSIDATEDTFCDEFAEVACHNMYGCCSESQIEQELGVSEPRTEAQCREDKRRLCVRATASLRDSLAAGRVTFNPMPLNACLEAIATPDDGTCSTYVDKLPWTDACDEPAWTGTVAVGGTCFFDHDCAGSPKSAECGPDQKCAALPTGGFPCPMGVCAEGFFCGTGTCQAKLAEGAPCTTSGQCLDTLFCDTMAMPAPVCSSRKPGGAMCTSDLACISGDCVPGRCALTQQQCFVDTQCSGHCANSTAFCTVGLDYTCNTTPGHCDVVTSFPCSGSTGDSTCVANSAGTKCIFNISCVPGDCVGDPICTAPLFLADYCVAGLGLTP